MQTNYRVLSALLLILTTALVSSAPAIAALIPTVGYWAYLNIIFGLVVALAREYVKEKGDQTPVDEPPAEA